MCTSLIVLIFNSFLLSVRVQYNSVPVRGTERQSVTTRETALEFLVPWRRVRALISVTEVGSKRKIDITLSIHLSILSNSINAIMRCDVTNNRRGYVPNLRNLETEALKKPYRLQRIRTRNLCDTTLTNRSMKPQLNHQVIFSGSIKCILTSYLSCDIGAVLLLIELWSHI